jgi:hypothetical protein
MYPVILVEVYIICPVKVEIEKETPDTSPAPELYKFHPVDVWVPVKLKYS